MAVSRRRRLVLNQPIKPRPAANSGAAAGSGTADGAPAPTLPVPPVVGRDLSMMSLAKKMSTIELPVLKALLTKPWKFAIMNVRVEPQPPELAPLPQSPWIVLLKVPNGDAMSLPPIENGALTLAGMIVAVG